MTPLPDESYDEIAAVLVDEAERLLTKVSKPQASDEVIYQGKEGAA